MIAARISAPPIVGVPALLRCVCGPSERTRWPTWYSASQRIMRGPTSNEIASAVSAARIARSVRYWKT